jgi:hypothetical protein
LLLAEEELVHTNKKRTSRLVAEVDVLRARDAVINAKQNLGAIESQWRVMQAELATDSANPGLYGLIPRSKLYILKSPPSTVQTLSALKKNARQLQVFDLQLAQMSKMEDSLGNQLEPQLDLVLGGGLRSEVENFSRSTRLDQPQYLFGVNFRYPLGQHSAKADVTKLILQRQQLRLARNSSLLQLEAQ